MHVVLDCLLACSLTNYVVSSLGDGDIPVPVVVASLASLACQTQELATSLTEFVDAMHLTCPNVEVQEVTRDGNCFFSAVCRHLDHCSATDLRTHLMTHIMELPEVNYNLQFYCSQLSI